MPKAIVLVLDSFGIGAAPDAERFGDQGACTLGSIAQWCEQQGQPLRLDHLVSLGLVEACLLTAQQAPFQREMHQALLNLHTRGDSKLPENLGVRYAACAEQSAGKDTPSGHWEMMGCPVMQDWGYFPREIQSESYGVFPAQLMQQWLDVCGLEGSLGNCHASGTEIIQRLGDEHLRSGRPICYTSADSVFQVAAHEETFGLQRLLECCEKAKPIFDTMNIARVIARPFLGRSTAESGSGPVGSGYFRTAHRKDYTTEPPEATLLDDLIQAGREVISVGKIGDIFAHRSTGREIKADGNHALFHASLEAFQGCADGGMVFANLVDFDTLYGHRRDPGGYARALMDLDGWLQSLLRGLQPGDLLALTADHGCDPTWLGSDHTREYVPLLMVSPDLQGVQSAGLRTGFADLGQTLAQHLGLAAISTGASLL